ncbi:MAG: NADPH:quinone reductase [Isosphaeraceae bacterium]|nr:NADPH:quinone reductase [Isosphaeraceae bacterium]
MRAAYIEAVGGPEMIRVGELPKPVPGPGQVLVAVGATSFNPIDLYLRSGIVAMPMAFPYVVGCDVAGTVVELGPGASRFRVGDRVWGSNQGLLGRPGATAEFAAIGEEWLYPTPANVTDVEAASIALVGITAHLGLYQFGRLSAGETVYISGGSGGVGSIVIQMAKAAGARVATTAGSLERVEFCRRLGADLALNYKTDDVPVALREFAESGIDVWFETQREPNLEVAIPLLRKRGRMIVMAGRTAKPILPLGQFYPRDCSLLGFAMFNASPEEQRRCADDIVRLLADGSVRPHIGRVFPLEQAADAQRLLEENTLGFAGTLSGKVVVEIGTKP